MRVLDLDRAQQRAYRARDLSSRRTPLNFFLLFFTSMKRPVSRLRFVQAVFPISLPLRWLRFRTAPIRLLSPVGSLLTPPNGSNGRGG